MKIVAQRPTTQLYNTNYTINECVYGKYLNWQNSNHTNITLLHKFYNYKKPPLPQISLLFYSYVTF